MASTEPNNGSTSSGPSQPTSSNNKRLQQTQAKVDEVVGIMRVNVEKVLERDTKLSELDNRADALQQGASQFEQSATKLKRKQWWNNMKMMIIMGVIAIVILIILIVKLWPSSSSGSDPVETATKVVTILSEKTTLAPIPGEH